MTIKKNMLKKIVVAFVATISLFAVTNGHAAEGGRIVIQIQSFKFMPENQVIAVGDVVIWINNDIVPHTITSNDYSWDSGEIGAGEEWETVVTADMAQEYFCQFHPSMTARLDIELE